MYVLVKYLYIFILDLYLFIFVSQVPLALGIVLDCLGPLHHEKCQKNHGKMVNSGGAK